MAIKDDYDAEQIASNNEDDHPEAYLGDFDIDRNEVADDASSA